MERLDSVPLRKDQEGKGGNYLEKEYIFFLEETKTRL